MKPSMTMATEQTEEKYTPALITQGTLRRPGDLIVCMLQPNGLLRIKKPYQHFLVGKDGKQPSVQIKQGDLILTFPNFHTGNPDSVVMLKIVGFKPKKLVYREIRIPVTLLPDEVYNL